MTSTVIEFASKSPKGTLLRGKSESKSLDLIDYLFFNSNHEVLFNLENSAEKLIKDLNKDNLVVSIPKDEWCFEAYSLLGGLQWYRDKDELLESYGSLNKICLNMFNDGDLTISQIVELLSKQYWRSNDLVYLNAFIRSVIRNLINNEYSFSREDKRIATEYIHHCRTDAIDKVKHYVECALELYVNSKDKRDIVQLREFSHNLDYLNTQIATYIGKTDLVGNATDVGRFYNLMTTMFLSVDQQVESFVDVSLVKNNMNNFYKIMGNLLRFEKWLLRQYQIDSRGLPQFESSETVESLYRKLCTFEDRIKSGCKSEDYEFYIIFVNKIKLKHIENAKFESLLIKAIAVYSEMKQSHNTIYSNPKEWIRCGLALMNLEKRFNGSHSVG